LKGSIDSKARRTGSEVGARDSQGHYDEKKEKGKWLEKRYEEVRKTGFRNNHEQKAKGAEGQDSRVP